MKKRILSCMLLAAMIVGSLASCGGKTETTTGGNESTGSTGSSEGTGYTPNFDEDPYEVKFMYLLAQEGDHFAQIGEEINKICLEEMNMTVELIPVTYGTQGTTLNMMLPAGEPLDVFVAWGGDQGTYLDSGYIRNWADYGEYLPAIYDYLGDNISCCYIGDTWTVIPSNFERCAWTSFLTRRDLMQELGYSVEDFEGIDIDDMSSFDKLTKMFEEAHAKWPEMTIINGTMAMGTQTSCYCDGLSDSLGVLDNYGQDEKVTNWYESENFYNICKLNKEWYDKGLYSMDIVTNQDNVETVLKAGNTFAGICNAKPNTEPEKLSQTAQDICVIKISKTMLSTGNFTNGYCLATASEDPAKAAAWYNWAFQSQEFNDLINWGIEGIDWVENEDGLATYPEGKDVTSVGYHNDYGWIYPNQMIGHAWEGNPVDIWEVYEDFNKGDYVSKGHGFKYNNAPVINQVTACNAVKAEYEKTLVMGAAADLDATLAEFNEKLYQAGLQDIIDEKQKQLDEWRAAQG